MLQKRNIIITFKSLINSEVGEKILVRLFNETVGATNGPKGLAAVDLTLANHYENMLKYGSIGGTHRHYVEVCKRVQKEIEGRYIGRVLRNNNTSEVTRVKYIATDLIIVTCI